MVTSSTSGSGSGSTEQLAGTSNKPLHSGDVLPAIRSAAPTPRDASIDESARYRGMPYEHYLRTAHWRSIRNRALKLAGYQCERCHVGRDLQVHHLTYDRLGAEQDDDLEVVCRGCHLGLHVHELNEGLGLYFKIIREVMATGDPQSLGDLIELVKIRCARAKINYNTDRFHIAIATLDQEQKLVFPGERAPLRAKYRELLDRGAGNAPLTHSEACGIIAQLGIQGLMKPIPRVRPMTPRQADRKIVLRQLAALIVDQVQRCEAAEAAPQELPHEQ